MISVGNLWKRYGATWALRGLSFELSAGSVYGLIGPNGAGKTTTLRILSTCLAPTFGDGRICGHSVVLRPQAVRPLIGFMPEQFRLYDELLVHEYLELFAGAYQVAPRDQERVVDEVIQLTDLEGRRHSMLSSLSKGLRQRVLLAKCLIHDPRVLLLDEPASGLDPRGRIELRSILRTLAQMGKTVVISSHILTELNEMCDSVGVVERGRMIVSGPLDRVEEQLLAPRLTRLKFQGDAAALRRVLEREGSIHSLKIADGEAAFRWRGDETARAGLVATLVREGIGVVDFHQEAQDLEDLFLRISRGGPS